MYSHLCATHQLEFGRALHVSHLYFSSLLASITSFSSPTLLQTTTTTCSSTQGSMAKTHLKEVEAIERHPSRRFRCSLCNRVFSRKFHLKRHEQIHTGELSFACPLSPCVFNRRDAMARHVDGHARRDELQLDTGRRKHLPVTAACDACAILKIKCDEGSPCNHCGLYGIDCTVSRVGKHRARRRTTESNA